MSKSVAETSSGVQPGSSSGRHGILPKQETQAWEFVKANPKFDGRGVVVAIFDSGLDPGAPGLQVTSTGERKVIDLLDCTGSGDVDTSMVRKSADGKIQCLSGRTINIGAFEPSLSGEYHIGVKRAYELMPKSLVSKVTADRKEKFEKLHRAHLNKLEAQMQALQAKLGSQSTDSGEEVEFQEVVGGDKPEKEELAAQIEQAAALMSSWSDPGPLYDVIAWKTASESWSVVIDTSESGDAAQMRVMKEFHLNGDYAPFSEENRMNYSINVWKDGDVVEIVTNAGGHGTHVAGIVGANFGSENAENGVAPGCQLIGLKIGDSRLGSMETGTGLVRALIAARERKVDIINMSYGEPASIPNSGRIPELINELVTKHGIIFVTSASNSGPCLTTVGSPGASTKAAIAVAAVVSPLMAQEQYSMREATQLGPYNWSSRGPALDGGHGPSIAAPGGAIAPVPNWTLQKSQLMNGTSMASPNACGGVTLLLSALKQSNIPYSPATVRTAIENTASKMDNQDFTAQGHGVLQVSSAFSFFQKNKEVLDPNVYLDSSVTSRNNGRGIVLRDLDHLFFSELEETITIEPKFAEKAPNDFKINYDAQLTIYSTVPWIKHPKFFVVPNNGRSFKVLIQPPVLDPQDQDGAYFLGEIYGIDDARPEIGPVFTVPVTVIRTATVQHKYLYNNLTCGPSTMYRKFYTIPSGANWATINIKSHNWPYTRMALLAAQQIIPDVSHKHSLVDKYFALKGSDERTVRMPVVAGLTLEVVVGQMWSALGSEGSISFSVEFSGVSITEGSVALTSYGEIARVTVHNAVGTNTICPTPKLVAFSRALSPSSSTGVVPLGRDRDMLSNEKLIHQMVLSYTYTTDEANVKVLPRIQGLSKLLYESPFESQLIMVYDSNRNLVATVDYNPEWVTLAEKGTFTFRVQLRNDDISVLERFKNLTLTLERRLKDKGITLPVYQTLSAAISNGKKFPVDGIKCTSRPYIPLYIGTPTVSSLPAFVKAGDVLYGYMSLAKIEGAKKGDSWFVDTGLDHLAIAVEPIKFVVPQKPTSGLSDGKKTDTKPTTVPSSSVPPIVISTSSTPSPSPNVSKPATPIPSSPTPSPSSSAPAPSEKGSEAVSQSAPASSNHSKAYQVALSAAISHLGSLQQSNQFEEWFARVGEFVELLPSLNSEQEVKIQWASYREWEFKSSQTEDRRLALRLAANTVIDSVNQTALAVYLGTRHPNETPQEKASIEKLTQALVKGLSLKLTSYARDSPEFTATLAELSKWADPASIPSLSPVLSTSSSKNAVALRALRKKTPSGEKISKANALEMVAILKALGWQHWVQHVEQWNIVRFQSSYGLF